ncbi:hypothetical protein [Desertivirga xinjiangensis]|uniref:hypothetical protein n=1 Tax=Desertivirga xinjiangensis TaxID=539206 RepID=UPI00210BDC70|nr:hypothetical protein [Pedobacter xinjiangensis]
MISVITGDVINSRQAKSPQSWLPVLKGALSRNNIWEIYRGDSFQAEDSPEEALLKAIYIKANIKTLKNIDVRIAIGIGCKDYNGSSPGESNGQAFILSGEKFELLKKERLTLALHSPWPDLDYEMNIAIRLALIAMDNWGQVAAETVKLAIEHPEASQQELAEISGRSQSSVSEALKRASFSEIMELNDLYQKKLNLFISA